MKKQITFLAVLLLFTTNIFAQKINTQTVIGSGSANGGTYRYEATIKTKIGSSGSYIDIGISNYKITSFSYQGNNAEKFVEANFPIVINNIQTDVSGRYSIIYSGNGILVGSEPFKESGVQQGDFITRIELEGNNLKSVKDYLKDDKSKIQNISISLYSIELKNEYFEELSRIRDLMDKKLKANNEIERLKNQIRTLDSNKKEDIVKKTALNKKLQELDTENTNDYASEIETLQDRLQSIEEKEKLEKEKQNAANPNPNLTLKKGSDSDKDNKEDKEITKYTTETKITKGPCQYLEDYRAQLKTAQYQGQIDNIKKQIAKLEIDCEKSKSNAFPATNTYNGYNNSQQKIQQVNQQYDKLENTVHQGIKSAFSETINKSNKQEEELTRKIESGEFERNIWEREENRRREEAEKRKQYESKSNARGDYNRAEEKFRYELNLIGATKNYYYKNLIEPKANAKYVYMTVFSFDGFTKTYDKDGYNQGQFSYSQPIQLPLDKVNPEYFVNFLVENNYLEEYSWRGSQSSVLFGHSQNEVENKIAQIIPKYQKYISIKRKQINLSYTNLATYYNAYVSSTNSEAGDVKNKLFFFDKLKDGVFYKRVNKKGFGLFVKYGKKYIDLDIPNLEGFKSIININNETALLQPNGNSEYYSKFKIGKEEVFVREKQDKKKFYTIDVFGGGYYGFKKGLYKSSLYNYYTAPDSGLDYNDYNNIYIYGAQPSFSTGSFYFIHYKSFDRRDDSEKAPSLNLIRKELKERDIDITFDTGYGKPFKPYLGAIKSNGIYFFPVKKITLDSYENAIKGTNKKIGKLMFVKVKQVEDLGYRIDSRKNGGIIELNSDVIDVDNSIDYELSKKEFDKTYNFLSKEQKNEVLDKEILNYFIEAVKQYQLLD